MRAAVVIVGGGAAGSVMASRLSEDPDRSVILLEAGPDYPDPASIPADLADGRRNAMTSHDWGLRHRPWPGAPVRLPMPRGRVVGGSSQVNTCLAVRSPAADYDHWGLPDWSWEEVLPAFKRLESDEDFGHEPWHGDSGPLPIRRTPVEEMAPWQQAFLEAAEAWLTPEVRARPNLRIVPEALAVRVVFAEGRAVGVAVRHRGVERVIEADEEVVLTAGAIHTPGILLRSGIGPAATLARLDLPVVVDAPGVGPKGIPVVSIMGHVGRPRGVGRLEWHSADPEALPEVRSRLLLDPGDLELAVDAMELAVDLAHHPAMAQRGAPIVPGPRAMRSRAGLRRWVRRATDSGYHPSGTVPMGLDRDPMAPCDLAGRVRGVAGLRVADASLFPEIPTGNIHLPTLMVAERLADAVRGLPGAPG